MAARRPAAKNARVAKRSTLAPKKVRKEIPAALATSVKTEFGNRCAMCREPYVTIHHIDENPSNNNRQNLIPLCPNCHHGRVHGYGGNKIDRRALELYRELGTRFAATGAYNLLLKRSAYITSGMFEQLDSDQLSNALDDLLSFVRGLKFGPHFEKKLSRLLRPPRRPGNVYLTFIGDDYDTAADLRRNEAERKARLLEHTKAYKAQLDEAKADVAAVLDEILLAQDPR